MFRSDESLPKILYFLISSLSLSASLCTREIRLGEFGVYDFRLEEGECQLQTALEPVNANLALLFWEGGKGKELGI
jgi:hypothetical protein